MKEIFFRARSDSKVYQVPANNLELGAGDLILFESEKCQEVATVIKSSEKGEILAVESKGEIIRRLNDKDLKIDSERKAEAKQNIEKCGKIVEKHQLPMEVLDADLSFDGSKLTFYFSAPGRVDFRSLVSELASTFQKLIRLQQVGARDRARCVGGIGRCGQQYCCKRFIKGELETVSTDMAYDQNLGQMGPNRTTGACGKLMCCLKFELPFYQEMKKKLPAVGSTIKTKDGKGIVVSQCVVKSKVTVQLENKNYLEVEC